MTTPTDPENVTSPVRPADRTVPLHARASTVDAPRLGADASADELVADIEATRNDLGDTVDALAQKFDVKSQAQHTLDDARTRATDQVRALQLRGTEMFDQAKDAATDDQGHLTPQARAVAIKGAAVAATVLLVSVIVRRRRNR